MRHCSSYNEQGLFLKVFNTSEFKCSVTTWPQLKKTTINYSFNFPCLPLGFEKQLMVAMSFSVSSVYEHMQFIVNEPKILISATRTCNHDGLGVAAQAVFQQPG